MNYSNPFLFSPCSHLLLKYDLLKNFHLEMSFHKSILFLYYFKSFNITIQLLPPPSPFPLSKSPPYIINPYKYLWKWLPLYHIFMPRWLYPFSPVQRHLKFSTVIGTLFLYNSISSLFNSLVSPINKSKNTNGFGSSILLLTLTLSPPR